MQGGTPFENQELKPEVSSATHDRIKIKSSGRTIVRKKKRKIEWGEKILSRNEILAMISKIPKDFRRFENKGLMYRALISLLYLTGARINELLTIKKSQFEFTQDQETGIKYVIVNNIPTLKRKPMQYRTQFMRKDIEEEFIEHVRLWMAELTNDDALLFPINSSRAWQIVEKYTGKWDHYFRHARNTDLARLYGFNSYWLQKWNGWSRISSSEPYVNLVAEDLKEKVLGVKKRV